MTQESMSPETREILEKLTAQTAVQSRHTEALQRQTGELQRQTAGLQRQTAELRRDSRQAQAERVEFRREMAEFRREMAEFRQEFQDFRREITGEVRQAHVLIESNRSTIELVAEGVTAANERIDSLDESMDRRFDEQRSFVGSLVRDLSTRHGRRLDRLERHTGLG